MVIKGKKLLIWKGDHYELKTPTEKELNRLNTAKQLMEKIKNLYNALQGEDIDNDYYIAWCKLVSMIHEVDRISPIPFNTMQYYIVW